MDSYYSHTDQVAILRERIAELSRIRQGFTAHLGSSLYEATKDDERLTWGRESLYEGIAMCDAERERLLERIASLEQEPAQPQEPEPPQMPEPQMPEPEPALTPEPEIPEPEPRDWEQHQEFVPPLRLENEFVDSWDSPDAAPQELIEVPIDDEVEPYQPANVTFPTPNTIRSLFAMEEPPIGKENPPSDPVTEDDLILIVDDPEPSSDAIPSAPEAFDEAPEAAPDEEVAAHETSERRECPKCGAPISEKDIFCLNCGISLASAHATTEDVHAHDDPEDKNALPVKEELTCPACGAAVEPTNKFCMTCGAPLQNTKPHDAPKPQPKPMVCPECGNPVDSSFKFCMKCGHRL